MINTIGYEKADLNDFLDTLSLANVAIVVDIRERAQSRKKGFSKTALSEALNNLGIEYLHFRELGDPKEGRNAARRGDYDEFRRIFSNVMDTEEAKNAVSKISELEKSGNICLLCYERDFETCHRKIVADAVSLRNGKEVVHLGVKQFERAA